MNDPPRTTQGFFSLSIVMTLVFAFGQIVSFLLRYTYKINYSALDYGVFAFFISTFSLFVTISQFALSVPIVSRISANPDDREAYEKTRNQIASTSFPLSIITSVVFIIWTISVTGDIRTAVLLGCIIALHSVSVILHNFPRGRDKAAPAIRAVIMTAVGRVALLTVFILGLFSIVDVFLAALIYSLPLFGWWVSYFHSDGLPKLERPNFKRAAPYYKEGFMAFVTEISVQIPVYVSIVTLTLFSGFAIVGDFDIALIFYSGFAVVLSGISFVIRNKARALPDFQALRNTVLKKVIRFLLLATAVGIIVGIAFQSQMENVLILLQLPVSIYWPSFILLVIAIPPRVLLTLIGTYFQGRGAIREVGIMVFGCTLLITPMVFLLALNYQSIGAAIGICIVNLVTVLTFVFYGETRFEKQLTENE